MSSGPYINTRQFFNYWTPETGYVNVDRKKWMHLYGMTPMQMYEKCRRENIDIRDTVEFEEMQKYVIRNADPENFEFLIPERGWEYPLNTPEGRQNWRDAFGETNTPLRMFMVHGMDYLQDKLCKFMEALVNVNYIQLYGKESNHNQHLSDETHDIERRLGHTTVRFGDNRKRERDFVDWVYQQDHHYEPTRSLRIRSHISSSSSPSLPSAPPPLPPAPIREPLLNHRIARKTQAGMPRRRPPVRLPPPAYIPPPYVPPYNLCHQRRNNYAESGSESSDSSDSDYTM